MPPTRLAITGQEAACASIFTKLPPSDIEGTTVQIAPFNKDIARVRETVPINFILSPKFQSFTNVLRFSSSCPSPAINSLI